MKNKSILSWSDVACLVSSMISRILKDIPLECMKSGVLNVYGVPRGGVHVATLMLSLWDRKIRQEYQTLPFGAGEQPKKPILNLVTDPKDADIFVDDIIDSGNTKRKYQKFRDVPFYTACAADGTWKVFPWEVMLNEGEGPEENIVRLLQFIGEDPHREGLEETPRRVLKSYDKLFGGYRQEPEDVFKTFTDGACDELVLLKNIEFYSTCEHHMLPFYGKAHIAYIPSGKVIGVSKLARLLEIFSRRLQIQERIGKQVTDALNMYLNPLGAACILEAQHFCMTSRGVEKQDSVMVTSSLSGVFRENTNARTELLQLIQG